MPLDPGEELSDTLRVRVPPSVMLRWRQDYHLAIARGEIPEDLAAAFVLNLLERYERDHVGAKASPFTR